MAASDNPVESEIKLALAPGEGAKAARTPPLSGLAGRRSHFSAVYFDTPKGELASQGLGLRLRREGRRWRATLKASGESSAGLHRRPEWEYPARPGVLDLSRFAGTPLAQLPDAGTLHARLRPILVSEFQRTVWHVSPQAGSRIEVALDEGRLVARGRVLPLSEIEIEVLEGPVSAAFDVAESLASVLALRPEPASKLARGLQLAAGARPRPVQAGAASFEETPDACEAARRIAASCLAHAQANEAGVIAASDIEFVHQLRVALRRLRSALRLFGELIPPELQAQVSEDLKWVGGILGRCRDWDVFVTETLPLLAAAQGDAKAGRALLAGARARQREARRVARDALLSPRYGLLMIRLARWLSTPPAPAAGAEPLEDFASRRLRKGARRIALQTREFATLDAAGRHRLRILVKRQRYAVDFLGSLFRRKMARRHARALARAQDTLGLVNDCANALAHVRDLAPSPGYLEFARGWFAAREAGGVEAAFRSLGRAAALRRFWRRKANAARDSTSGSEAAPPT